MWEILCTRPHLARELLARIRAVLRGGGDGDSEISDGVLESGPARIDAERHVVSVNGDAITLSLREFDLLEYLMRNSGRVLHPRATHRSCLGRRPANPVHLVTVRGLGYKLEG